MSWIIPLTPEPQTFTVTLVGVEYRLTIRWGWANEGGWLLDLAKAEDDVPLVAAMPLVTGCDLFAAYGHLEIGGAVWVSSADDEPAGEDDLGTAVRLVFQTEDGA
ncbi:phage baseplate plug protein [Rhodospirillum sp. A1_3_36]|uniref:phage baseplate plug family protein n=1 Tax=Rhodospirillum sp. A1_3_36 TaxID=3391666 RepID=UPI0039A69389